MKSVPVDLVVFHALSGKKARSQEVGITESRFEKSRQNYYLYAYAQCLFFYKWLHGHEDRF